MLTKLALIAALCAPGLFAGFGYRRTLTIDHTKIGATDNINFPVLVSLTDISFRTVANGGRVTNANGYDLVFFSDFGLTAKLDFEIEIYSATTGAIVMWVRVPTVSHTVDTAIYMGYGNAAIGASEENKTGVWDTNFVAVYHLPNGSVVTANDSTGNALNGTITGSSASTGKIDGAITINSATDKVVATGGGFTGPVTMDAWVNPTALNYGAIVSNSNAGTASRNYIMMFTANPDYLFADCGGSGLTALLLSSPLTLNVWTHLAVTCDGTNWKVFMNGAAVNTTANSNVPNSSGNTIYIGQEGNTADNYTGTIDEVRISNSARSADWILSEYNNLNAPTTFAVLGAEVVVETSATPVRSMNKVFIL
ncbi:MAG: LamG domain-containing protein [Acidobacteriota bacterium]|nr:LamG domain-containing protein [Acidobacteriota bacterium]